MADDIELPPIPQANAVPRPRPSLSTAGRKRSQRSYELQEDDTASLAHTSSDPALFSSDETPDLENYSGVKRRKKKTYAGTWWGDRVRRTSSGNSSIVEKSKRKFKRNYDSGIFMPSDDGSTDLSSDSSFAHDLLEDQKREEYRPRALLNGMCNNTVSLSNVVREQKASLPVSSQQARMPENIQHARQVIARCMEENKEYVDLSDLKLDNVPAEVNDINNMIRENDSFDIHFSVMSAKPRLFLSNNLLRRVPLPILNLTNLRELSLRRNKLTHLPTGIRALTNLKTLNIAGNKLQYLPREVLDLVHDHQLRELTVYPNPWLIATENSHQTTTRDELQELKNALNTGTPSVPKLTEFILRQLSLHNTSHQDLRQIMPPETPAETMQMLERLYETQLAHGAQCTSCERSVVMPPRREVIWSDAWTTSGDEKDAPPSATDRFLPFEHLFCGQCRIQIVP